MSVVEVEQLSELTEVDIQQNCENLLFIQGWRQEFSYGRADYLDEGL